MNSYKKGWGYPLVEAPVRPSKTKTSAFRSRAGVSCVVADFAERMACKRSPRLRSGQATVTMLTCAEHILRSEEHTSELQSRLHLVCRLLLEKKKETTM